MHLTLNQGIVSPNPTGGTNAPIAQWKSIRLLIVGSRVRVPLGAPWHVCNYKKQPTGKAGALSGLKVGALWNIAK